MVATFRAVLLLLMSSSFGVSGQELVSVRTDRSQVFVGQSVEIVVDIATQRQRDVRCGFVLSMGDGTKRDVRITEKEIPFRVAHTYASSGNYSITVEGKTMIRGLNTVTACSGHTRSVAVFVTTEDAAVRAAAEAKAAAGRAVIERQAAEEKAAAEIKAAAEARAVAKQATAERAASESKAAAQRAAASRATAEAKAAAERANTERATAEAKAAADRAATAKTVSGAPQSPKSSDSEAKAADSSQSSQPAAPQKKPPVKAKSSMDL